MYRVIKTFRDAEDDRRQYAPGDTFNEEGVSKERLAFLASNRNKLGTPVIQYIEEEPERAEPVEVEPEEEVKAARKPAKKAAPKARSTKGKK